MANSTVDDILDPHRVLNSMKEFNQACEERNEVQTIINDTKKNLNVNVDQKSESTETPLTPPIDTKALRERYVTYAPEYEGSDLILNKEGNPVGLEPEFNPDVIHFHTRDYKNKDAMRQTITQTFYAFTLHQGNRNFAMYSDCMKYTFKAHFFPIDLTGKYLNRFYWRHISPKVSHCIDQGDSIEMRFW